MPIQVHGNPNDIDRLPPTGERAERAEAERLSPVDDQRGRIPVFAMKPKVRLMTSHPAYQPLLSAVLALDADDRQRILDDIAAHTGQRANRATLIERHPAVSPSKARFATA